MRSSSLPQPRLHRFYLPGKVDLSMEITKSDLLNVLWESDIDTEEGPHWGYSGRGMYGRTCFGFVGDMAAYGRFLITLTLTLDEGEDFAREFADRVATDSMGFETIFYFPGIRVLENQ
jgi:hypothetical protein